MRADRALYVTRLVQAVGAPPPAGPRVPAQHAGRALGIVAGVGPRRAGLAGVADNHAGALRRVPDGARLGGLRRTLLQAPAVGLQLQSERHGDGRARRLNDAYGRAVRRSVGTHEVHARRAVARRSGRWAL